MYHSNFGLLLFSCLCSLLDHEDRCTNAAKQASKEYFFIRHTVGQERNLQRISIEPRKQR